MKKVAAFGPADEIQIGYWTFSMYGTGGSNRPEVQFTNGGEAFFQGDVTIGSRGSQWLIVESNGIAHLQPTARNAEGEIEPIGPTPTRDIPGELTMVEEQLALVMLKLRMAPQKGWEVWDGSS